MSETVTFDDELAMGFQSGPRFSTSVTRLAGGRETRNANWSYAPRFFSFAKPNCDLADAQAIAAFFYDRRGMAEPFRLKDWADFELSNELIGTGDGSETEFQCTKTYGTANPYIREIHRLNTTGLVVTVNGSPVTPSSTTGGLIVLSSPAGNGQEVRVTGTFYCLVRFGSDGLDIEVDGPSDNRYARISGLTAEEILP